MSEKNNLLRSSYVKYSEIRDQKWPRDYFFTVYQAFHLSLVVYNLRMLAFRLAKSVTEYLTIIPRVHVGYEMWVGKEVRSAKLAIIISYPASASSIIVLQSNLHVRSPPVATTSHKRQPSQNTENVLSYSLILEPLVNDHLLQATATTFWADSFRIFYCFQPPP